MKTLKNFFKIKTSHPFFFLSGSWYFSAMRSAFESDWITFGLSVFCLISLFAIACLIEEKGFPNV